MLLRSTLPALGLSLIATSAAAQGASSGRRFDETVVVTGTAEPTPASEAGRAVDVVSRQRVEAHPVHSAADAARLAGGVEVRSRGDASVQADFSIRGAAFGQTLVLVDGIRLNDAQTGHHNGDIPVPLAEIERIEVLRGPGSALYGADALGGVVQVITRRGGSRAQARAGAGSFGTASAGLSGRVGGEQRGGTLAFSARRSDGFVEDRELRVVDGSGRFWTARNTRLGLSHSDKAFGAAGFYGPAPSREWTRQTLASLDRAFSSGERLAGNVLAYARAHRDHFVYDRRNPALSDNRHDSRSVGVALRLHHALAGTSRLSAGVEAGTDWLDSTSLGRRGYGRGSVFAEAQTRVAGATLRPGLRLDGYGRFGSALSPSLSLAAPLAGRLRWRASAGRAFRVPTFTELYYQDPGHVASSQLRPERAWAADAALDFDASRGEPTAGGTRLGASLGGFLRREHDVIDWVRESAGERWRTQNVREARTLGVEAAVHGRAGPVELRGRYTWLDTRTPGLALLTKYVDDYARHSAGVDAVAVLPRSIRVAPSLEHRRKADGRSWWLFDARVSRAFGAFDVYAEGRNLLDARYQELRGVDMPGRSLGLGLRATTH